MDNDGICDYIDTDTDGDGVSDRTMPSQATHWSGRTRMATAQETTATKTMMETVFRIWMMHIPTIQTKVTIRTATDWAIMQIWMTIRAKTPPIAEKASILETVLVMQRR